MRIAFLVLISCAGAFGWGGRAHGIVNRVAIQTLPGDGPAFLLAHEDLIAQLASMPDTWRAFDEPFLKIDEDPNHGWFREQFAFMKQVPRSRYEFAIALHDEYLRIRKKDSARARLMNVRWAGTLPYAAVEGFERVKSAMRLYRMMKVAGTDTKTIELQLAYEVGWLGHYAGDGAMPLHATIHNEGWKGPNPNGYTTDPRIHGRLDSAYPDLLELSATDIRPLVAKPQILEDAFDAILAHCDRATGVVEQVYRLEKAGAFGKGTDEARKLISDQVASGAALLRDLVHTAWIDSGKEIEASRANPAAPRKPGRMYNGYPESLDNPQYNPATGSAPAPKPR
jgi:hypothetical protein